MKTGTVHHEAPDTGATCCVYPKGEVRYSTDWREVTCSACISFRPKGVSVTETSVTFEGRAKAIVYPWSSETSPLEFEAAQAVLIARIAEALRTVEREALERAAMLVAGWHVNKGGYGILSEAIAELNGDTSHD